MSRSGWKLTSGLALMVFGLLRLAGVPAAQVIAGWPGQLLAVLALAGGWWLYRTNCGT